MILVHRPQSHFSNFPSGPVHQHRRHPSAPPALVAAVQPTKTPGLLSLSKPQQPAQRRSPPKPKHKSPQPAHAVQARQGGANNVEQPPAKLSQSPEKRGRQGAAGPKPKAVPRSVSNRRNGPRQASPPIPSTQAEPTTPTANKPAAKGFFDVFSAEPITRPPVRPAPKLSKPSGKLAKRRGQDIEMTPPKSIAIPARNKSQALAHKRASAPPEFTFRICDDISEAGDATDVETSAPSTPTQAKRSDRHVYFDDGPKTAPLTSSASMPNFPFSTPSPPSSMRGNPAKKVTRPRHIRSPSEGVFHMSDAEASPSSNGTSSADELNTLFAGMLSQKRAMFASSTLFNSPDPEVLPPPSF